MLNPYQPQKVKIIKIEQQTESVKLFELEIKEKINFQPGQIIFISIPNFGEAPFAICSHPDNQNIEFCVRQAGRLTSKLHSIKEGDYINWRGPHGNCWPVEKDKNYLFVVGGLGLLPLRSLILNKNTILGENSKVQIFYGAKNPQEFLFKNEFDDWRQNNIQIELTIDKTCPDWGGYVGTAANLCDQKEIIERPIIFLCGPPIMYKFVIQKLDEKKCAEDKDIYMSLERRMHCGVGICQHCAIGSKYVCKDGPIFSWEEIKNLPDVF